MSASCFIDRDLDHVIKFLRELRFIRALQRRLLLVRQGSLLGSPTLRSGITQKRDQKVLDCVAALRDRIDA